MQPDDEVIYTITITDVRKQNDLSEMAKALPAHIGSGKMRIAPVSQVAPGSIDVPRLFTHWRGDASEQTWQEKVKEVVGSKGTLAITVVPWNYAPGYPQGEPEL